MVCALAASPIAVAADPPFAGGWTLDGDASTLGFQSIKMKDGGPKAENSRFATVVGAVDEQGLATLRVALESVDTNVDLRNVRMRFLFFETYRFPEATITSQLEPRMMAMLVEKRRLIEPTTFDVELHGVTRSLTTDVRYTMFSDDRISVATIEPVVLEVENFGMMEGIRKLQDAAKVDIVPSARVSFDLVFGRGGPAIAAVADAAGRTTNASVGATAVPVAALIDGPVAVETAGEFSVEECAGRFDILSRTGAVYFASGSARLDDASVPLLSTAADIMQRCPDGRIVINGHTDSVGGEALNMRLSQARARSVQEYLAGAGVEAERMNSSGYGESRPVAPNDSPRNRGRNRRIEFAFE